MAHPLVDRIALCDREADRISAIAGREKWRSYGKFNPRDGYSDLTSICASDLDALVIITQPWLHAPQCIQAMESGKHVYSAVPVIMVPSGDEILEWCDRLVATCLRTGMKYMLGETSYYRPQTMYCRRRAAKGEFGDFVYAEGEYFHDVDSPSANLRDVTRLREASKAGREWVALKKTYLARGLKSGPMFYPTHSTSGPISVMRAHAERVCAWGFKNRTRDAYFSDSAFSNETALFQMSNGSTMRICESREIGHDNREAFRVYGTKGSFEHDQWVTTGGREPLSTEDMRESLPPEVEKAYSSVSKKSNYYGAHGGSHAFLAHEFVEAVASDLMPAINAWEAVRYMAAGVVAHHSALRDGEVLNVPDWGDAPGGE